MHLSYHERNEFAITNRVFAFYKYPNNGRKVDKEKTKHFKLGDKLEVADLKVDRTTYVMLNGQWFNAVQFEFFDAAGNPVDIYTDAYYNPYLQFKMSV